MLTALGWQEEVPLYQLLINEEDMSNLSIFEYDYEGAAIKGSFNA